MNLKIPKITLIIVMLVILVIALPLLGYFALNGFNQHNQHYINVQNTPVHPFDENFSIDANIGIPGSSGWLNVSQGTNFKVNLTLTSKTADHLSILMENLKVTYYSSQVRLGSWISTVDDYSSLQKDAFNFSYSINPIILQPAMFNSSIITINLENNAPIGQYTISVIAEVEVLGPNGTTKGGYVTSGLEMIVYSKVS